MINLRSYQHLPRGKASNVYRSDKPRGGVTEMRPHGGRTEGGLRGAAFLAASHQDACDRNASRDVSARTGDWRTLMAERAAEQAAKIAALREAKAAALTRGMRGTLATARR